MKEEWLGNTLKKALFFIKQLPHLLFWFHPILGICKQLTVPPGTGKESWGCHHLSQSKLGTQSYIDWLFLFSEKFRTEVLTFTLCEEINCWGCNIQTTESHSQNFWYSFVWNGIWELYLYLDHCLGCQREDYSRKWQGVAFKDKFCSVQVVEFINRKIL